MARIMFYILIWVAQVALVALLVNSSWVQEQVHNEKVSVEKYLGQNTSIYLVDVTGSVYQSIFLDTGIVSSSYALFLPDRSEDQKGMENLAPWLMVWMEERLDAFWWLVYQAIYRTEIFLQWLPYLLPLLLVSLGDGLVQRKVQKSEYGYANPVRYHAAWHALTIFTVLPLLYISLPLAVHPLAVPLWAISISAIGTVLFANIQHRI